MKHQINTLTSIIILMLLSSTILTQAQTRFKTLNYLYSISGTSILSGQHNDQKPYNGSPTGASYWTDEVFEVTGKYPALYGCDLLFHGDSDKRWAVTYEAEEQWNKGAVINMMWHACPPDQTEPCNWDGGIKSSLTAAQWTDLLTEGGTLNETWKSRIDDIAAPYLQYLENKEVEVLWRPFHEQNQTVFWWNSGGAANTKALWKLTHDYMSNELGLSNLIWSWDVQDIHANYAQYNPGDDYFDLAAIDIYSDGFTNLSYYNSLVTEADGKPVAIGECFNMPTASVITNQPEMSFFMIWAYGLYEYENGNTSNTTQQIIATYSNPKVITLDEMPGWQNDLHNQQTTIVDFDDIPYEQGGWNGTGEVLSNPKTEGINASANVCKYTIPADAAWGNCAWVIFEDTVEYKHLDSIQIMVLAPSATQLYAKLEDSGGSGVNCEAYATPVVSDDWQMLTLKFSEVSNSDNDAAFDKLALFFNVSDAVGGEAWYYDNVVVNELKINATLVADAGVDQSVNEGATVVLDGSGSSNANDDYLFYEWSVPTGINLDLTDSVKPTFTAPAVLTDTNFVFRLVVSDGTYNSVVDTVEITVKNTNAIPIANAGADQSVFQGELVTLNGTESADVEGGELTYEWKEPAGVVLDLTNSARPTFTAPSVSVDTEYIFSLTVNDGIDNSLADTVIIIVKHVNTVPIADAGPNQNVLQGDVVTLDGGASSDAEDSSLTYVWTAPTNISLDFGNPAKPTFTAPIVLEETKLSFSLVVNDGTDNSDSDEVLISVFPPGNVPPVAYAGTDQSVNEGSTVILDGSGSTDANNDSLSYSWEALSTQLVINGDTLQKPTFIAPELTTDAQFKIVLTVSDGIVESEKDTVVITILQVNKAPIANAGSNQIVNEGTSVVLSASLSMDADGDELTFLWESLTSEIIFSEPTVASPTFEAPEVSADSEFEIVLTVSDGTLVSEKDTLIITVLQVNIVPVANAGINQIVSEGDIVTLDGSASSDADADDLTYKWTAPAGIELDLSDSAKPTFTAPQVDADTKYEITLVVNDGTIDSEQANIVITVENGISVMDNDDTSVAIYPNPSNGTLYVKLKGKSTIEIVNMLGDKILEMDGLSGINELNISAYAPGLYLIIVNNSSAKEVVRLVLE